MSDTNLDAERFKKLKLVLTKLLEPGLKLSDDTLLEKLYSCLLSQFRERNDHQKTSDLSIYIPWICLVVKKWNSLKKSVKVFAFRISSIIVLAKPGLKTLVDSGMLQSLCKLLKGDSSDQSILQGYCELMHFIIEQDPTCSIILEHGIWRDLLYISVMGKSMFTSRKASQCMARLVANLTKAYSPDVGQNVLDVVFDSLRLGPHVVCATPPAPSPVTDYLLFPETYFPIKPSALISSVSLATDILSELLSSKTPQPKISALISKYPLKEWAWNVITDESENIELIVGVSKLLTLVNGTSIVVSEQNSVAYTCMRALTLLALHHAQLFAQKHLFSLFCDVCIDYQTLWSKYGGTITYTEEDRTQETFDIENNLIITQCMPLFICMKVTRVMESDVMDMFADKVFSLSCKETQRVCYIYRDCLREAPDRSIEALCLQGIRSFLKIPNCYTKREQAVMSFQCMMHTLKEFVPEEVSDISANCIVAQRHPGQSLVSRFPSILSAVLDGLITFIAKFDITWRDSLETVCIMTFIQSLANNIAITPLLCAKVLKLGKLVITSFIPPNLALLVDSVEGSSMEQLGVLILKKMRDIHWEVRDSALELLQAVTSIAQARFPAFQGLIVDNHLPESVVTLMSTDPNAYVRASAYACLQEMVQIQSIWDTCLYDKKLLDLTMSCLMEDTEGIVRRQAALLANDLYSHQVIPAGQLERLLDTMHYVSWKDLHWETKVACLTFWKSVITKAKVKEGMMDGEFPSITFSSIKKKIITLDPPEIRSRLGNIMSSLSSSGCLSILWKSLNDESDLEVVRKCKELVEDLVILLRKYEVPKYMPNIKSFDSDEDFSFDKFTEEDDHIDIKKSNEIQLTEKLNDPDGYKYDEFSLESKKDTSEEVIEETVSVEDMELLSRMSVLCCSGRERSEAAPRHVLPPRPFLSRVLTIDLHVLLNRRQTWISSADALPSIIDDILAFQSSEPNLIDCY